MFTGPAILEVVERLERRQASLWHACQLRDWSSYLRAGGIPSRGALQRTGAGFTPFVTDTADRDNGVWDMVFTNLDDFGRTYATEGNATPNAYGPIALQVRSSALLSARSVAVCLRSAGARGFSRAGESLEDPAQLEALYRHPPTAGFPRSAAPRFSREIAEELGLPEQSVHVPEVSIDLPAGMVPADQLVVAWVDPISLGDGASLPDQVRELAAAAGLTIPVRERSMSEDRRVILSDLCRVLSERPWPLRLVAGRVDVADLTRVWARDVLDAGLDWQFDRFARYLHEGTLLPLVTERALEHRRRGRAQVLPPGGALPINRPVATPIRTAEQDPHLATSLSGERPSGRGPLRGARFSVGRSPGRPTRLGVTADLRVGTVREYQSPFAGAMVTHESGTIASTGALEGAMRTSEATRTDRRVRPKDRDEAETAELLAYISGRLSEWADPSTSEPRWVSEALEGAWAWLLASGGLS